MRWGSNGTAMSDYGVGAVQRGWRGSAVLSCSSQRSGTSSRQHKTSTVTTTQQRRWRGYGVMNGSSQRSGTYSRQHKTSTVRTTEQRGWRGSGMLSCGSQRSGTFSGQHKNALSVRTTSTNSVSSSHTGRKCSRSASSTTLDMLPMRHSLSASQTGMASSKQDRDLDRGRIQHVTRLCGDMTSQGKRLFDESLSRASHEGGSCISPLPSLSSGTQGPTSSSSGSGQCASRSLILKKDLHLIRHGHPWQDDGLPAYSRAIQKHIDDISHQYKLIRAADSHTRSDFSGCVFIPLQTQESEVEDVQGVTAVPVPLQLNGTSSQEPDQCENVVPTPSSHR